MAAGAIVVPTKAKLNALTAPALLNQTTYKLALLTSAFTPAPTTNEVFADVSANEIAAGNGYTAGGVALTGPSLAVSGANVVFTSSAASWTAAGGAIPAWRYGVIYAVGTFGGKVNPIVGYFLGDATPADIPATASGQVLTITPNASGLIALS